MSHAEILHRRPRTAPTTKAVQPHGSSHARQITSDFLSALHPAPSPETVDTALLVVSELVTNALQHGSGVTDFSLAASPAGLHLTVGDASPRLPNERTPDLTGSGETGGFGWPLVRHFASDITIHLGPDHKKSVRVILPL